MAYGKSVFRDGDGEDAFAFEFTTLSDGEVSAWLPLTGSSGGFEVLSGGWTTMTGGDMLSGRIGYSCCMAKS